MPEGITHYFEYKKDPTYKNTFNYYIKRKGNDKGFIKVSIRISDKDPKHAWIKTIFITYKLKWVLNFKKFDIITMSEVENQCATTTHLFGDGCSDPEC